MGCEGRISGDFENFAKTDVVGAGNCAKNQREKFEGNLEFADKYGIRRNPCTGNWGSDIKLRKEIK